MSIESSTYVVFLCIVIFANVVVGLDYNIAGRVLSERGNVRGQRNYMHVLLC